MTQYDFGTIDPATKSGSQLSTDLNNWRNAQNSHHKGSTAPSYAIAGMLWLDDSTSDPILKIYTGTAWIAVGQMVLADGVWRTAISADGNASWRATGTGSDRLLAFSGGTEMLDLGPTQIGFFGTSHVVESDKVAFGTGTVDTAARMRVVCRSNSPALSLVANGVAGGNTVANEMQFRFTGTEDVSFLFPQTDGTSTVGRRLYLDHSYGAGSERWGVQTPFELKNTGTPSSSPSDGVVLYAAGGNAELWVRDEAGNTTQLSPHGFPLIEGGPIHPLAWSYSSMIRAPHPHSPDRDIIHGQVNVDMMKAVLMIEALWQHVTGQHEQLLHATMRPDVNLDEIPSMVPLLAAAIGDGNG